MHPLQGSVAAGIEHNVGEAQKGGGRVDAVVQGTGAKHSARNGKDHGTSCANQFAHERAVSRTAHLSIVFGLHEHVESIGRG